ncbi:MAG TPA: RhuM family protein [bacterium]|nr:RhuM family protein [bacterium]HQL11729.1 RhuM family protein [bacterium]
MEEQNIENKIVIYKSKDGKINLDINFDKETVWLTQEQISTLFGVDRTVVTRHINNIFKDGEIGERSNVQKMHIANSDRPVKLYNLDVILAVGYRVNAKKGIEFRKWASSVLKDYMIDGYVLNQKRLEEIGLKEFDESILLIRGVIKRKELTYDEYQGLLNVIVSYSHTWSILHRYGSQNLIEEGKTRTNKFKLDYNTAISFVNELRHNLISKKEASDNFGKERTEKALEKIINNIYKYSTVEERAANLLYDIIKEQPFIDGNKRIAAFLFVLFLNFNNCLLDKNGDEKIDDNTLAAITLLISESNQTSKDIMIKLILNLIIHK